MSEEKKSFLREVFSDDDGTGSFSRCAAAFCVLATISWVCFLVYKNHILPDFSGLTLFNSAIYGINRAHAALTSGIIKTENENSK